MTPPPLAWRAQVPPAPGEPATLDHAGIAARLPHAGRMCLLDRLDGWSDRHIVCTARGHDALDHPLRSRTGLLAPCAIEYAAQAMALHSALRSAASAHAQVRAAPGVLVSVRDARFAVHRLDDVAGALRVTAELICANDAGPAHYRFEVSAGGDEAGRLLAQGRATVVIAPADRAANDNPAP